MDLCYLCEMYGSGGNLPFLYCTLKPAVMHVGRTHRYACNDRDCIVPIRGRGRSMIEVQYNDAIQLMRKILTQYG